MKVKYLSKSISLIFPLYKDERSVKKMIFMILGDEMQKQMMPSLRQTFGRTSVAFRTSPPSPPH